MYSIVHQLCTIHSILLLEVGIKSRLDVVHDWLPAVIIVDKVSKTGRVNNSQTKTDSVFDNICMEHQIVSSALLLLVPLLLLVWSATHQH